MGSPGKLKEASMLGTSSRRVSFIVNWFLIQVHMPDYDYKDMKVKQLWAKENGNFWK
jgi:hypothetical protein